MDSRICLSGLVALGIILLVGCKNDDFTFSTDNEALQNSYNEYNNNKSLDAAAGFATLSMQYIINQPEAKDRKMVLEAALMASKEQQLQSAAINFLTILIKDYPRDKNTPDRIFELATLLKELNKEAAGNTLLLSYINQNKNSKNKKEVDTLLGDHAGKTVSDYLLETGERIFINPDPIGINRAAAQSYVDACEAFAIANPDNVSAPDYLYRAADVSKTLKTHSKTLTLYDWIIQRYPEYEKAPEVLFLKGFILQNDLINNEAARKAYGDFLNKYPNHPMAESASFLLENIDKTDDEILKMLEEKSKKEVQ